jgi:hypothetical protein
MYLLDSNTFIEAKNKHYNMSFCPAYWDWMDNKHAAGMVSSISLVYDELVDFGDALSEWARARKDFFISVEDEETQTAFMAVARFVQQLPNAKDTEKTKFLSKADPWLIAKAMTRRSVLVTHESLAPENTTKVKIPNVCAHFGVEYMDTYELLQRLEASFVFAPQ